MQKFLALLLFAQQLVLLASQETSEGEAAQTDSSTDESDPTKDLLKELTIDMAGEVLDGRTFMIRPASSRAEKKAVRLGNLRVVEGEEDEAKEALTQIVEKQMVFWKAAAEEHQPTADESVTIVDAWTMKGNHLPKLLLATGHFSASKDYEHELARDILSAEAEVEKQESYKQLEEALKESEKERKKAAKEAREKAKAEHTESIGVGGWIGIGMVIVIVLGVLTNFGRGRKSKPTNPNRKRGPIELFWNKLKGA